MPLTLHLVPTPLYTYATSARIPAWQLLRREADRLHPELATMWQSFFRDARAQVDMPALQAALARGNLLEADTLLRALWIQHVDLPARGLLPVLLRETVARSAVTVAPHLAATIEATRATAAAEAALRTSLLELEAYAGAQIQGITQRSLLALRSLIREGFAAGTSPERLAQQIQAAIGLTRPQMHHLGRLAARLRADGASAAQIARELRAAAQLALQQRALTIGRTQAMWAANAGQDALWQAAVAAGHLDPDVWQREWLTASDERTCQVCRPMNGQRRDLAVPFVSSTGTSAVFPPIHPSCRCTLVLVPREEG